MPLDGNKRYLCMEDGNVIKQWNETVDNTHNVY